MSEVAIWDDPVRDYRQRYELPDQFIWDIAAWPRIQFDGYMKIVCELLPRPPARVLDVGCGPGFAAKILCEQGFQVTGLDYNSRGIQFGKIVAPEADLFEADARLLDEMAPLHGRFDAAVHMEVMEHIPPQFHPRVLRGIWQSLVPRGVLVVSAPSNRLTPSRWDYKHFDRDELVGLIRANGFGIEQCVNQGDVNVLASPLLWRLLSNKYYDLRCFRRALRQLYLHRYNLARNQTTAGRFIVRAIKQ
jgi:SAM-dependent methyltransferase